MYKNKNFEFTTRGNGAEIMAHQICWLSVIVCIYFLRVSLHENTRAAIICIMLSINQREIRKINSLMIRGTKKRFVAFSFKMWDLIVGFLKKKLKNTVEWIDCRWLQLFQETFQKRNGPPAPKSVINSSTVSKTGWDGDDCFGKHKSNLLTTGFKGMKPSQFHKRR